MTVYTPFHLLKVLRAYAPDDAARLKCDEHLSRLREENEDPRWLDLQLTRALHDGLEHGNWLWLRPPGYPSEPLSAQEPDRHG